MTANRLTDCIVLLALSLCGTVPLSAADSVDYLKQIKPLLRTKCQSCHGALKQNSSFRVDTAEFLRKGGDSGPGFKPGKADDSLLLGVLTGDAGFKMPPKGAGKPLTPDELALFRQWINAGAPAPENEVPEQDPRQFWSYQTPIKPDIPEVKNKAWVRNEIDAFLAAEHEQHNLVPRPPAEPAVLLRRLYLDLTGLPPTTAELEAFLADPSEEAYVKTVDKLLASPRYGERWGRHWMDVWRYSDWYGSRGINEIRYSQRHIWRWRDWIVESVNADKPYDRMIVEMLAGDELEPDNPDVVRATGFLGRNWYKFDRNVWMFDTVEHTSVAFLGLTMKCARCHDHKYDPLDQVEYYRFRAFFEPHNVRTDALSGTVDKEKDATLGMVLKDGLARVYDKELEQPTYLFQRGDDRQPDKEYPLTPAVPVNLTKEPVTIKPVELPLASYYPALRPEILKEKVQQAEQEIKSAKAALHKSDTTIQQVEQQLADLQQGSATETDARPAIINERFQQPNPELWQTVSGKWEYIDGCLRQTNTGAFRTMVSQIDLPLNFQGRLRYKTLEPGQIHSVGLFFDAVDLRDAQAIYTAISNNKPTVQAFHRTAGRESYPRAGIFPCEIELNKEVALDFVVEGQQLNVWLDGQLKLAYTMPVPRQAGKFALWNHSAHSEFYELRIEPLAPGFQLAQSVTEDRRSPFAALSKANLQHDLSLAQAAREIAELNVQLQQAELKSLKARIAAEQAKVKEAADYETLAKTASRLEREAAALLASLAVKQAHRDLATLPVPTGDKPDKKRTAAEEKVATAEKKLQAAQAAVKQEDSKYTPLGETFPRTSTGRRLALARWIADEQNPRTARVAVNHIWLRHFNQALVPTVANFGLNGRLPTHPELLDWLAVTFMEQGWQMKPLHRQIVLSSAYRMSSAPGESVSNRATDPNNRYLWRMNSRRMEAEMVRDCLLSTAGTLDETRGGPELDEKQGETIHRRSLYFRNTPNEKMEFLELFDLANPNACYERLVSVVPQQALALTNSSLSLDQARLLAEKLEKTTKTDAAFIQAAFKQILSRPATAAEITACTKFLERHTGLLQQQGQQQFPGGGTSKRPPAADARQRARENLVHVLYSHNDFVTVR